VDQGYRKGELKVGSQGEYESDPADPDHTDWMGVHHFGKRKLVRSWPVVQLPHSCNEWVIGGPAEIRLLIADLEAALVELEAGK
jgi:hypothetical protein